MRKQIMKKGLVGYSLTLFIALVLAMTGVSRGELIHADGNVTLIEGSAYYAVENASDGITTNFWVTEDPGGYPSDYYEFGPAPIMVMDLGSDVVIDAVAYWGYFVVGNSTSEFSLRFATGADGPVGFGTSVTSNPTLYPGPEDNTVQQNLPMGVTVKARYVEVTVTDNYFDPDAPPEDGGDRVGFAELQFNTVVPEKAWEPSPGHQQEDVDVNVTLTWKAATIVDPLDPNAIIPDPTLNTHVLYMSSGNPEDPNVFYVVDIDAGDPVSEVASYGPISLARDKVYYWRVDEVTDSNTVTGDLWYFSTLGSKPEINPATPADAAVFAGEEVSFTVVVINPFSGDSSGLSYQWYKAEGGGTPVGTDSDTYTIASASDADIGEYYCVVTIINPDVGTTATSRTASLDIKKMIGRWPFDENLDDVVGGNTADYTATSGKVRYGSGVTGQAGDYAVDLSDTIEAVTIDKTPYTNAEWSLAWWDYAANVESISDYESMIASGDLLGYEILEADRLYSLLYAVGFYNLGTWIETSAGNPYPREEWNYHVLSYNAATHACTWYINGERFGALTGFAFTDFDTLLYVGNCRDDSQPYMGFIDDLRLYNYPLDAFEVAQLYVEVMTDEVICVGNPEYDITGPGGEPDCVIDINDLAAFLTQWLDHGYYPYHP
jgi:hypothetical protein